MADISKVCTREGCSLRNGSLSSLASNIPEIALLVPGFVLMLIRYAVNRTPWALSVILGGVGLFLFVAAVIHGRILAGRWREEINSLQNMTSDGRGHVE
jgi:hypothetical protein